jgi:hypothetical protein
MDAGRFDAITRSLTTGSSRRDALRGLGTVLGLGSLLPLMASAKKNKHKHKKKKKKLQRNSFNCVNVGGKCRGNDANCCSGLCDGKKPKKGKKNKSECIAHNTGGCTPERSFCALGETPAARCGLGGTCIATTGNAGFCARSQGVTQANNCRVCNTDKDCEGLGFGPGSACTIVTGGFCNQATTNCVGFNGSSGTACLPPSP